jgi:ATPases involved in chromosome partitioning
LIQIRKDLLLSGIQFGQKNKIKGINAVFIEKRIKAAIKEYEYSDGVDFIIIDTAAKITSALIDAINCSDLVIIPIRPSGIDVWPIEDILPLIEEKCNGFGFSLKFLINLARFGTGSLKGIREKLVEKVSESNRINITEEDIFKTTIFSREVYSKSIDAGKTVFEKVGEKAVPEIESLREEILNVFD